MAPLKNKRKSLQRANRSNVQPTQQRRPWEQPIAALFLIFGMLLVVLNKSILQKTVLQPYYSDQIEEQVSAKNDSTSTIEHLQVASSPNFTSDSTVSWCPSALMKAGAMTLPTGTVWTNLHHQILNATYSNIPSYETLEGEVLQGYHEWVDTLFSFYKVSNLRRSVMNPAPPKEIVQVLKLANEIKLHNSLVSDDKDKRSLRVLVMGGSVTLGVGCNWPEGLGMVKPRYWARPGERCMWSAWLEKVVDDVIFEGQKIFKVENIAAGGLTSETGSIVFEYELFKDPENVPDVIISAFSANESFEPITEIVFYEFMQKFVKAAQNLQPCNDHAPLVIMVDDFFDAHKPSLSLEQTGRVYMHSQWSNLMAVDYAIMLKYKIHVENLTYAPLLFSKFDVHNGIGMHMALGWTVAFNLLNSIVNVCNDVQLENESHDLEKEEYQMSAGADRSDDQQSSDKFTIDPSLRPNLVKGEPPYHQIPSIKYGEDNAVLQTEFEENVATKKEYCQKLEENPDLRKSVKCPWHWFYSPMSGFSTADHVKAKMDEVLLLNEGWKAEGRPIVPPRAGWYSHTANSAFSIKIENLSVDTKYVVILSMKSYSPRWVNSKLGVSTTVVKGATIPDSMQNRTSAVDWNKEESIFYIDGYHDVKTSVHYPFTIPIQGGGAKAGESVIIDAKLVDGLEFKIAGIAVCAH